MLLTDKGQGETVTAGEREQIQDHMDLSSSSGNLSKSMHVSDLMTDTRAQVRSQISAGAWPPKIYTFRLITYLPDGSGPVSQTAWELSDHSTLFVLFTC